MKELLIILVSSAIVNNVVLSQFLGLCPFLGVSKSVETAAGMGGAIIFVITLSSFVTGIIYNAILVPTNLTYLQTIVFILLIAALVQFVEMFLKKTMPSPVSYTHLDVYKRQLWYVHICCLMNSFSGLKSTEPVMAIICSWTFTTLLPMVHLWLL